MHECYWCGKITKDLRMVVSNDSELVEWICSECKRDVPTPVGKEILHG